MRLNLLFLIVVSFVILGLTWFLNQPQRPDSQKTPTKAVTQTDAFPPIPYFTFTTIRNMEHKITEYEGKTVLLNFWASWCAPCLVEFPKLLDLAKQNPEDIVIIALSVDKTKSNINRFLEKLDEAPSLDNVIIGWDPRQEIAYDLFQTIRYPETYVIGPDQTLRLKVVGADVDFSSEEFLEKLPISETFKKPR